MIKCGIIGGAGYTAGELIRLLLNHPDAELTFINSSSNAGNKITDVHGGLYGENGFGVHQRLAATEHSTFCSSVPLMAIRKSSWRATRSPRT